MEQEQEQEPYVPTQQTPQIILDCQELERLFEDFPVELFVQKLISKETYNEFWKNVFTLTEGMNLKKNPQLTHELNQRIIPWPPVKLNRPTTTNHKKYGNTQLNLTIREKRLDLKHQNNQINQINLNYIY